MGTNPTLKYLVRRLILSNIEQKVENLLEKIINNLGYDLYDVEYVKEGPNYYLRIIIDNQRGITIEDCEIVNNAITDVLDKADYIKEQYFLEVSSPGLERVLKKNKHLENCIGEEIEISLFKKDENEKKTYKGFLKEFDNDNISIINIENDNKLSINRKSISKIKLIYNWEQE